MKIVTSADFEAEVLKSDKPVLVDFFADWCGPCRTLAPLLEQIAGERADSLKIVKVDVDASQELAAQYSIRSMPTLLIIRNGDVIAQQIGAVPKSALNKFIDGALAQPAGTKLDLAPAQVKLSDADKQTLRDVFAAAVNANPDADTATTLLTPDGSETTLRKLFEKDINSGKLFKDVESILSQGVPLQVYVDTIKRTVPTLKVPKQ
jgi:thioredoxin 1